MNDSLFDIIALLGTLATFLFVTFEDSPRNREKLTERAKKIGEIERRISRIEKFLESK